MQFLVTIIGLLMLFQSLSGFAQSRRDRDDSSVICSPSSNRLLTPDGQRLSPAMKSATDCEGLKFAAKRVMPLQKFAEQLLQLTSPLPEIKPFFNGEPDEAVGFPQKQCEVAHHKYHLTKSVNSYILPECTPDTVYSWGSFDKLQWFLQYLPPNGDWIGALPRSLFTTPTAAGTFGYGQIPIRIKLKPNIKFKLLVDPGIHGCDQYLRAGYISQNEISNTIITKVQTYNFSYLEHTICSADVIESWSYATQEHYDEILRDHKWMTTKSYFDWEGYSKLNGVDKYLEFNVDQRNYNTDFSQSSFNERLTFLRVLTEVRYDEASFGQVVTRSGRNKEAIEAEHFRTKKPIYFNPD